MSSSVKKEFRHILFPGYKKYRRLIIIWRGIENKNNYYAILLIRHLLVNSKREESKERLFPLNIRARGHNFTLQPYNLLTGVSAS